MILAFKRNCFIEESGAVKVCMSAEISVFSISVILARAKGIIYPVEVTASRLVCGFLVAKLVAQSCLNVIIQISCTIFDFFLLPNCPSGKRF